MSTIIRSLIGILALVLLTSVVNAQTPDSPYAGSSYTYKVKVDDKTNTITWSVFDGATELTAGTDYTITTVFTNDGTNDWSEATIVWGAGLSVKTYTIQYSEEANSCITLRNLDVMLKANNTFDVAIAAQNASDCNALHDEASVLNDDATTDVRFTVTMSKDINWNIDSWKYKFTVTPSYTTGGTPPTIGNVWVAGSPVSAVAGKYADTGVAGTTLTREIVVRVIGNANKEINVALTLSDAFAVNGTVETAKGGSGANSASTIIKSIPAASAITF